MIHHSLDKHILRIPHKSGGLSNSYLSAGIKPIEASYFIQKADYIVCDYPS
jgi:Pyruvate/2-oxoacid:ferredoxin oxidoreductase gamma subunit